MEKMVLSVVAEKFRDKQTGVVSEMYRVYLAADDGRVGALYAQRAPKVGSMVSVGLKEKDGKLLPKLLL